MWYNGIATIIRWERFKMSEDMYGIREGFRAELGNRDVLSLKILFSPKNMVTQNVFGCDMKAK